MVGSRGHTWRSLLSKLRCVGGRQPLRVGQPWLRGAACLRSAMHISQARQRHAAAAHPALYSFAQLTAQAKLAQQAGSGGDAGASQAGSQPGGGQAVARPPRMRIVALSATLTGKTATARLLGAQVYVKPTEREVQLRPYLVRQGWPWQRRRAGEAL